MAHPPQPLSLSELLLCGPGWKFHTVCYEVDVTPVRSLRSSNARQLLWSHCLLVNTLQEITWRHVDYLTPVWRGVALCFPGQGNRNEKVGWVGSQGSGPQIQLYIRIYRFAGPAGKFRFSKVGLGCESLF